MPKTQLKKLSPTHTAIITWLVANPGPALYTRCSRAFGITPAWLSTITKTDAFRAGLAKVQCELKDEVVSSTKEKLEGVADAAVMKLGEVLERTADERLVKDIAKDSLSLLGFGANKSPAGTVNNTQINIGVTPEALQKARARRTNHYGGNQYLESKPASADEPEKAQTAEVQTDPESSVGPPCDVRPELTNLET